MTRESLQSLTKMLLTHLPEGSYTEVPSDLGKLPIDIPFIHVEPWVYDGPSISFQGGWQFTVEMAIEKDKAPVMACPDDGRGWSFVVPCYMLSPDYVVATGVDVLTESQWHLLEHTATIPVQALARFVRLYQDERTMLETLGKQASGNELDELVKAVRNAGERQQ